MVFSLESFWVQKDRMGDLMVKNLVTFTYVVIKSFTPGSGPRSRRETFTLKSPGCGLDQT